MTIVVYEIRNSFGRFGNQIITIMKIISRFFATCANQDDSVLRIKIMDDAFHNFHRDITINDENLQKKHDNIHHFSFTAMQIFYWNDMICTPQTIHLFKKHFDIIFSCEPVSLSVTMTADDTCLVIHSRAGDTIGNGRRPVHRDYIVYPVSLIVFILRRYGFDKLWIVAEDPEFIWIRTLSEQIKNDVQVTVFHDAKEFVDWSVLRQARHLLLNFSTFTLTSTFFNSSLQRLFVIPQYIPYPYHTEPLSFELVHIGIDNYVPPHRWKADNAQKHIMLNHPIDNIRVLPSDFHPPHRRDTWR